MSNTDEQFIRSFESFVLSAFVEDLMKILEGTDESVHHSLLIKFPDLIEADTDLCHGILSNPNHYLLLCDKGLVVAQRTLFNRQTEELKCELSIKTKVHTQITELPDCPQLHRTSFPSNDDIGNFLRVTGTVVRVTSPKVLEFQRNYMCSKCKHIFTIQADYEMYYIIPNPYKCKNPDGCNGSKITPIKAINHYNCKDYQEIKIQEQVCKLDIGCMPRSMWVTLEDNIVDTCKPGDDISVCGTIMRRWRPIYNGSRCDIEIVIKGNYIEVSNDRRSAVIVTQETHNDFSDFWKMHANDPLRARNRILASFCPQVFGLHIVKLALSLVLAGGVHKVDSTGNRIRGASHLLLVGDPATGKSHLMRFAAKLSTRSVVTSGVGTTTAGLTVCAVKENGVWQLEAGALVLADGGICCIDEFGSIKEHDRTSIHEAMEQQTISVAKAGIVCKLNTRCAIIATTNTSGNYDPEQYASLNVALSSPLLSRFDLVLTLLDSQDAEWDQMLSSFIIDGRDPLTEFKNRIQTEDLWELDKLRAYFCIIKHIKPILTSEAGTILTRYYQAQRNASFRNAARTTVRLLESLVRLSQAHARFMFRDHVTVQDTIIAIVLMEYSMQSSFLGVTNTLHASFSEDPTEEYKNQVQIILHKLELEDILEKELHNLQINLEASVTKGGNNKLTTYLMQDVREAEFQLQPEMHKLAFPTSKSLTVTEQISQVFTGIRKAKEKNVCKSVELQLKYSKRQVMRKEPSKRKKRKEDMECENDANKKLPRIQILPELDTNSDELIDLKGTQTVENSMDNVNINHNIETDLVTEPVIHFHAQNDNINHSQIPGPEINKDMHNVKAKYGLMELHNISTLEQNEGIEINNPNNKSPSIACADNHDTTKKHGKIFNKCDTTKNSQVESKKNLAALIKFGKKLTTSQVVKSTQCPTNGLDSIGSDLCNEMTSTNDKQARTIPINSSLPELQKILNIWECQTHKSKEFSSNLNCEAFDDYDLDI